MALLLVQFPMPFHARAVAVVDYPATATYVLGVVCVARRARLDLSLIFQLVPVFTDVPALRIIMSSQAIAGEV